jgi:hypothetical protein
VDPPPRAAGPPACARAHEREQRAQVGARRDFREARVQRVAHELLVVRPREHGRISRAARIDDRRVERDVEPKASLCERRVAVRDQGVEEERQEPEPDEQRAEAERAEHDSCACGA